MSSYKRKEKDKMAHSITSLIRIIYASRYASLGLKILFLIRTDPIQLILQNDVFVETKLSFQLIEQSNSVTVLVNNLRHTWVYHIHDILYISLSHGLWVIVYESWSEFKNSNALRMPCNTAPRVLVVTQRQLDLHRSDREKQHHAFGVALRRSQISSG